jgi:methylamine dehydrogenase accessory protein MauD
MEILFFIARLLLAAVFAAAGLSKLADRNGSRQALVDFGLPSRFAAPAGFALPAVELAIAVSLVPTPSSWWGALGAFALLLLFSVAIGVNLAKGRKPACHCFGQLDSAPIGLPTLLRNTILAAIAGLILAQGWITSQLAGAGGPNNLVMNLQGVLLTVMGAVLCIVVLIQGWLIYHLHRRLAALETRLAEAGPATSRKGLPVGIRAPSFQLAALEGETVTLDRLLSMGRAILLAFTNPACGPCQKLLPTLGLWQREHMAQLTIVNVTIGSLEANRANADKYGLRNVLIQAGTEVQQAYQVGATPGAVLVRIDGTIGSTLAVGEEQIGALIQNAIHSRRNGQPLDRALRAVKGRLALNWSR